MFQLLPHKIHVSQHHVDPTANVDKSICKPFVHVCQTTLVRHHHVGLSALSIVNVIRLKHVLIRNAMTLVLIRAD